MSATFDPPKSPSTAKLWAAVGVLGVAVLALGAGLVYVQTRPQDPLLATQAADTASLKALPATSATPLEKADPAPVKPVIEPKKPPAARPTSAAVKPATPLSSHASAVPPITPPLARPICANCGSVISVVPVQRDGQASGVGTIAGGVLGAVVGNQVGSGQGKTLATILGAVGGGMAGNTVEKRMKKETSYEVQVRMEDGSTRTLEQTVPPLVGTKVLVDGPTLTPASQ